MYHCSPPLKQKLSLKLYNCPLFIKQFCYLIYVFYMNIYNNISILKSRERNKLIEITKQSNYQVSPTQMC